MNWTYRVYSKAGHDGEMVASGYAPNEDAAKKSAKQAMQEMQAEEACVTNTDGSEYTFFSAKKAALPDAKRIMMDVLLCAEGKASRPAYAASIADKWETEVAYIQRQIDAPRMGTPGAADEELDIDRLYKALERSAYALKQEKA